MRRASALLALAFALSACATPPTMETVQNIAAPAPIVIGESYQLDSAILGDTREINVWVPPGYTDGREIGGVVYVLDGALDQDFEHIAGLGQLGALSWTYETLLIVGVQTKDRHPAACR